MCACQDQCAGRTGPDRDGRGIKVVELLDSAARKLDNDLTDQQGTVGRLDEAIALQEQSLEIKRRVLPRAHRFLRIAVEHMIFLLNKAGREAEKAPYEAELKALSGGN